MKSFSDYCDLSASAKAVGSAIMSEPYLRFRYDTENTASFELEIQQDDAQAFVYTLRRELQVGSRVPRVVKNLVGERFAVLQEASWHWTEDGRCLGKARLTAERFSGSVEVNVVIEDQGEAGCRFSFDGQLQADVPLIGGQLERMMVDRVSDSFTDSVKAIEGYLQGDHTG